MKRSMMAAMVFLSMSAQPADAAAQQIENYSSKEHPSFLEAAVFFMTGEDSSDRVKVIRRDDGIVSVAVKRLMLKPGRSAYDALWEFKLNPDEPCTILGYQLTLPYEMERLEFKKMPSPRAMHPENPAAYENLIMDLPHETWCHAKAQMIDGAITLINNTTMCDTGIMITDHHRLRALDYIRSNYCAGQMEPPRKQVRPY